MTRQTTITLEGKNGPTRATWDGAEWQTDDKAFSAYLNLNYDRDQWRKLNPFEYDPDPVLTIPEWAAGDIKSNLGIAVEIEPAPPLELDPGAVY